MANRLLFIATVTVACSVYQAACAQDIKSAASEVVLVQTGATYDVASTDLRSAIKSYNGEVLVKSVDAVRPARDVLRQVGNNQALVVWSRSQVPARGLETLGKRPHSVTVIHGIPRSLAEVQAIHGKEVVATFDAADLQRHLDKLKAVRDALHKKSVCNGSLVQRPNIPCIDLHDVPGSVADRVQERLDATKDNGLAIILGHVKNDRIHFHDGSSLELKSLKSSAPKIVVSCTNISEIHGGPGLQAVSGRTITYEVGARVIGDLLEGVNAREGSYRRGLLKVQNTDYASQGQKPGDAKPEGAQEHATPTQASGGPLIPYVKADNGSDVLIVGEVA